MRPRLAIRKTIKTSKRDAIINSHKYKQLNISGCQRVDSKTGEETLQTTQDWEITNVRKLSQRSHEDSNKKKKLGEGS